MNTGGWNYDGNRDQTPPHQPSLSSLSSPLPTSMTSTSMATTFETPTSSAYPGPGFPQQSTVSPYNYSSSQQQHRPLPHPYHITRNASNETVVSYNGCGDGTSPSSSEDVVSSHKRGRRESDEESTATTSSNSGGVTQKLSEQQQQQQQQQQFYNNQMLHIQVPSSSSAINNHGDGDETPSKRSRSTNYQVPRTVQPSVLTAMGTLAMAGGANAPNNNNNNNLSFVPMRRRLSGSHLEQYLAYNNTHHQSSSHQPGTDSAMDGGGSGGGSNVMNPNNNNNGMDTSDSRPRSMSF